MGNPLGGDANGRFATSQLAGLPNLELCTPILSDFETPYTITIHAPDVEPAMIVRHGAVEALTSKIRLPVTACRPGRLPGWSFCDSEFGCARRRFNAGEARQAASRSLSRGWRHGDWRPLHRPR